MNRSWTSFLFLGAALSAAPALAQIEKPSESELQAAPPQFQALLHGKSQLITRLRRGPGGGPPPGAQAVVAIPNSSKDPHDFSGYWGSGGMELGENLPGGGDPVGQSSVPPGIVGHTKIDANRLCFVNLGPQLVSARIYQDATKITMVYKNELRARRIYFADSHPAGVEPSYNGDSIAHWEGNTLVVDTIAIKGIISGLDADLEKGLHTILLASPTLHVVEHISRSADGKTLTDEADWSDPKISSRVFHTTAKLTYTTDPLGYDTESEDIGDMFGPKYNQAQH